MSMFLRLPFKPTLVAAAALCLASGATQAQTIVANFGGLSLTNITTLNGFGLAPPDTNGAIGVNNFVEFINGGYAVYNRNGSLAAPAISDTAFWTSAGISATLLNEGLSDPRIKYDAASQRWFAAEITLGNSSLLNNSVLVAVSNTSNPLSGWKATSYNVAGAASFNDYPTLGVDANAIYIGTNNFDTANYVGTSLSSIPKSSLLAALPTTAGIATFTQGTSGTLGGTPQALTNYGTGYTGTKIIGNSNTVAFNSLRVTTLNNTGAAGATLGATAAVSIAIDGQATLARQPNGSRTIDTLDNRFSGTVYQVGNKIYAANAVNTTNQSSSQTAAGNTVVHWLVMDATTNAILQEGTLSDGTRDLWQPSIAANANGDVVIGYNKSGLDMNISAFASVGKTVGGVLSFTSHLLLKTSTVNNYNDGFTGTPDRWGDYSATMIDPTDSNTFWTVQEWASGTTTWNTQISAVSVAVPVPEPGTYAMLLAGLAGLGFVVRRKARATA